MTGEEFRKWRREYDLTLEQVSDLTGVHYSTISRFEHNKTTISDSKYVALVVFKTTYDN